MTLGEEVMMDTQDLIHVSSFDLTIADIAEADIVSLHALSMSVGWPHRPQDWQAVLALGQGIVARDAIGRVLASAMWFEHDPHFATLGMVITSPRLQTLGAGRMMMEHVLAKLNRRRIGLNATRQARQLYASLGFETRAVVYQCQGEATVPPAGETEVSPLETRHLPALEALDRAAFGASRPRTLETLLETSAGTCLFEKDELVAYALCRPFGRGHLLGPVVAARDSDAIAVVRPHIARHAGTFLRIDTRQKAGDFASFLAGCGLSVYDTVTSMSLNGNWLAPNPTGQSLPIIYGLATQALS
jgi:GNAT superfamily N-acetyltransferase